MGYILSFRDLFATFEPEIPLVALPNNSLLRYLYPVDIADVSGSTLLDRTGVGGRDSTVTGGGPSTLNPGSIGEAIRCTQASGQRINTVVGPQFFRHDTAMTYVAHVKGNGGPNSISMFSGQRTVPATIAAVCLEILTDGSVNFLFRNDNDAWDFSYVAAPPGTVDLSQWSDIVFVKYLYSGTFSLPPGQRHVLYVNGEMIDDRFVVYPTNLSDNNGYFIGFRPYSGVSNNHGGDYDELALWHDSTNAACFSDAQAATIHQLRLNNTPLRSYLGL